jgi:hypothetical protein
VRYLHGGFGQLVDRLRAVASSRGVVVVDHVAASAVHEVDHGDHVVVAGGEELRARAVVIAAGSPAAAGALLGAAPGGAVGPPAVAACLELALRRAPVRRFVLGLDEPLYLSVHGPPARLSTDGSAVVHVARYGCRSADDDRDALESLARRAGVGADDVVHRRFLRRMVVIPAVPSPASGGLAGRHPVGVPDRPGISVCGDWVGPVGLLADAALCSGVTAGRRAAAAALAGGAATPAPAPGRAGAVAGSWPWP